MESVKLRDVSKRKQPKTQKWGVNLSNTGNALRKLHPEYSRRVVELINYGVHSGIFLKKSLGGNHLHFVKNGIPGFRNASVKFL